MTFFRRKYTEKFPVKGIGFLGFEPSQNLSFQKGQILEDL